MSICHQQSKTEGKIRLQGITRLKKANSLKNETIKCFGH